MIRFAYHTGYMYPERELVPPTADEPWYLIICGNLGRACYRPELARRGLPQYGDMLASVCRAGWAHVFFVPGSREFAGSDYETVLAELRALAAADSQGRLTILENESVAHEDEATGTTLWVTGSTLWTDLRDLPRGVEMKLPHFFRRQEQRASVVGDHETMFVLEDLAVGPDGVSEDTRPSADGDVELVPVDEAWWTDQHQTALVALTRGLETQPPGTLGVVVTHYQPTSALDRRLAHNRTGVAHSDDVPLAPHLGPTRLWFHAQAERDGQCRHLTQRPRTKRFMTLSDRQCCRLLTFCGTQEVGRSSARRHQALNTVAVRPRRLSLEAHRDVGSTLTADAFELVRTPVDEVLKNKHTTLC